MMLSTNLKSTANYKNIIFLFLGNHISHNFAIHTDKHNYHAL